MTGPGVPTGDDELLLPCGRDATDEWERGGAPPDEHEAGCPYCSAVRAERAQLDAAATDYLTGGSPDGHAAPPRLIDSVMQAVSTELRPGRPLPLRATAGPAWVSDTALGNALRIVLDDDPAFVPRRCSAEPVDGGAVRVWLTIAVSYAHFARHGDSLVRQRVVEAVGRLFDLAVESVEIEIVDVLTDVLTDALPDASGGAR